MNQRKEKRRSHKNIDGQAKKTAITFFVIATLLKQKRIFFIKT